MNLCDKSAQVMSLAKCGPQGTLPLSAGETGGVRDWNKDACQQREGGCVA